MDANVTRRDDWLPTRQSLLSRLKAWDDQESWRDFFNTYWRLIYGVAIKAGLSDQEAQDVVQETILSIAKGMRTFKYDPAAGSFKNWLLLITRRRIADFDRKRHRELPAQPHRADSDLETPTVEKIAAPGGVDIGLIWDDEWQKNLVEAAMDRVRRRVDARQFQIFDCYVLRDWPVKEVARTLGVSATQVYVAKHRVGAVLKQELTNLQENLF
jgi:RNA polymerase sigma factor (sigma-70 family)